jgi:uncharacterized membrane protein
MTQQPVTPEITSDDRLWAALGYPIGIIALIMLFIEGKKERPFIKFHAVQALALTVALIIIEIVVNILEAVLRHISLGICGLVGCFLPILWLLLFWPGILAFQGKYFDIPMVTKFLRGQHWIA